MEKVVQRARRRGLLRSIAAGLTLAGAIAAVAVLAVPTASGKSACPGIGSRVRINGFDPHKAKAGSNTEVMVWGSHLGEVSDVYIGPKGKQTHVHFKYIDNKIFFHVPDNAVSGPIQIVSCTSSDWSHSSLRV
jgi:hypothetical protein